MVIITWLAAMFGLILFYVAMVMKETASTVGATREVIVTSNKLVQESGEMVSNLNATTRIVKETAEEVSQNIVGPIKTIGTFLSVFKK
jgi:uncharacterized membrane protein